MAKSVLKLCNKIKSNPRKDKAKIESNNRKIGIWKLGGFRLYSGLDTVQTVVRDIYCSEIVHFLQLHNLFGKSNNYLKNFLVRIMGHYRVPNIKREYIGQ